MSGSAGSADTGIGRKGIRWAALPLLVLLAAACAGPPAQPASQWPLACAPFPPVGEAVADCGRRGPDGEIELRPGVLTDDLFPGEGAATAVRAVVVEGELLFALDSGRTAPALPFDNGPDQFVEGLARSPRDGKVGFVNEHLELVVPRDWDFAFPFEDGLARVCTGCTLHRDEGDEHSEVVGGQWGAVDRQGRVVVPVIHPRDELR